MAEITDFGPRKTIFILAIVVGCFAVLWPKIFYPMLTATYTHHPTSDSSACCEVIFESDVTAVDIMQEMCQNILRHHPVDPRVRDALKLSQLTPQSANLCREEVLARCGIDLSSFLAEREQLGKTYKQVLEEIRSFNSSLCLKMNFGVPLSQLGTPHLIRYHILMPHSTIRQERRTPPHAGGMHPAMRERGRAIPSSHIVPKIVDRADHIIPKMRPPLGGAGHVVPAAKGNGTMGIIMPLYTIGIILFFVYTIVKVLKKSSDSEIISEYPGAAAEKEFRKMVFSPEAFATAMTGGTLHYPRERSPHMTAPTIEELKDLDGAPKSNGLAGVDRGSKEDTAGQESPSREGEELDAAEQSPTVKVMGMEMTASCESGQKCSRPTTPIIPTPPSNLEREKTPPKPIYLEGALPSQCELLVTDSETQAEKSEDDDDAPVVLSGKMTLSLISLDQIPADLEEKRENKKNLDIQGEVAIDKKQKGDEKKVEVEEAKIVSGIVKSMEEKKEELKEDEDEQGINAEEDDVEEDVEEDVDEEDVDEEDADEEDADEEDADEEDADEEDVVEEGVDEEDVDDEEDDDEEEYVAKEEVVDEEEDVDEEDGEDEEEKDNDKRYRVYADKALDSDEKN
nr:PREDICTED: uncharacterized protein LOC105669305 isoform X2 [Linepithema humile]